MNQCRTEVDLYRKDAFELDLRDFSAQNLSKAQWKRKKEAAEKERKNEASNWSPAQKTSSFKTPRAKSEHEIKKND